MDHVIGGWLCIQYQHLELQLLISNPCASSFTHNIHVHKSLSSFCVSACVCAGAVLGGFQKPPRLLRLLYLKLDTSMVHICTDAVRR